MIFKINYNGDYADSIIVSGDTIEDVREVIYAECAERGWECDNCYSEEMEATNNEF